MLALLVVLGGLPARHVSRRTTPALAALGQLGGWAPDGGRAVMTTSTAPNLATLATGTTPNRHGLAAGHVARHGALRTAGDVGPDVPSLFGACIAAGRRTRVVLGDPRLAGVLGVGVDALCELDGDPRPPAGQRRGAVATDDAIVTDDAVVATVAHRFDDPADLTVALLGLPDAAAALHGPDSSAALDAYRATDDRLATLRDHLDRRWRELVIVVVSDHDQEPVDPRFPPVDIARAAADRDVGLQVPPRAAPPSWPVPTRPRGDGWRSWPVSPARSSSGLPSASPGPAPAGSSTTRATPSRAASMAAPVPPRRWRWSASAGSSISSDDPSPRRDVARRGGLASEQPERETARVPRSSWVMSASGSHRIRCLVEGRGASLTANISPPTPISRRPTPNGTPSRRPPPVRASSGGPGGRPVDMLVALDRVVVVRDGAVTLVPCAVVGGAVVGGAVVGGAVVGGAGGMRRRLDLAGALVAEPSVLFLDEPTTGLDPASRTELWAVIRELVGRGTTLLLTTQYLEEADHLADDILVIDHGRAIAQGTADEFKRQIGGERIELTVATVAEVAKAEAVLSRVAVGDLDTDGRTIVAPIRGGAPVLSRALDDLAADGVEIRDIGLRLPTLDEVFLSLTGHRAEHTDTDNDAATDNYAPTLLEVTP